MRPARISQITIFSIVAALFSFGITSPVSASTTPTLTFSPTTTMTFGGTQTLSATPTAGDTGAVTFATSTSTTCGITGSVLTAYYPIANAATITCTVTATVAATSTYSAVTSSSVNITVSQGSNYISSTSSTAYTYGASIPTSMPGTQCESTTTQNWLFYGTSSYGTCSPASTGGTLHHWRSYLYWPDPLTPYQLQVCEVSNVPTYVAINSGYPGGGVTLSLIHI